MKKRIARRFFLVCGVVAFFFAAALFVAYRELPHVKSARLHSILKNSDSVELVRLQGTTAQYDKGVFLSNEGRYGKFPIHGTRELSKKGKEFAEAFFSEMKVDPFNTALCHSPPYGLRMRKGEKLLAEVSLCWECSNVVVDSKLFPGTLVQIDLNSPEPATRFLDVLDGQLPYYRNYREDMERERERLRALSKTQ